MKIECIFIGNDKDELTKKFGLKKGRKYDLFFNFFPPPKKGSFVLFIQTPNYGAMACPYQSLEAFGRNWRIEIKQPMGASQWKEHGKKYGYWNFFINEILEEYNSFLCKNGYTDSDVYAEEPTAIERFLKEKNEHRK